MATRQEDLYDRDFYAWTQDQAAALHRLAQERWNGPLDLSHLALEVEDLGRSTRNAVRTRLQRIIEHALKLDHSAAPEPRPGWMNSIDEAHDQIDNLLTPTLRRDLADQLSHLFARTRRRVAPAGISAVEVTRPADAAAYAAWLVALLDRKARPAMWG